MATAARCRRRRRSGDGAPNVMVVVFDDLGFAHLGSYGSDLATPNIDALAARGLRFTNFHTTAVCSPTRACLLTGRNHHRVGMGMLPDLPTNFPALLGPAPARRRARSRRSCTATATRRSASASGISSPRDQRVTGPVRHVADRARLRPLLRLPQRRDEPVDAEPRARHEPRRTAARRRTTATTSTPTSPTTRSRTCASCALASRPAVPALVRVGRAARAAPGAARMDRTLPRPVRRRLGRVARRDARTPAASSASLPPDTPLSERPSWIEPWSDDRRAAPPPVRADDGSVRRRSSRTPTTSSVACSTTSKRPASSTTRSSCSCPTTARRARAVRTARTTSSATTSPTSPTTSTTSSRTSTTSAASTRAATTRGAGRSPATRRSDGGSATRSKAACATRSSSPRPAITDAGGVRDQYCHADRRAARPCSSSCGIDAARRRSTASSR